MLKFIGETYGLLTVAREIAPLVGPNGQKRRKFLCDCACGGTSDALGENLRSGHTRSCGCLQDQKRRSRKRLVIGARYGRLVVITEAGRYVADCGQSKVLVKAKCDCGAEIVTHLASLKAGLTSSCGCWSAERATQRIKHGDARKEKAVPEYKTWSGMIERCENSNNHKYPIYGGRGINVCARWRNDYSAFLADMGRKPSPSHSIDRIDVDGDYEPDNCRWATAKVQANNTRLHKAQRMAMGL